MKSTLSIIGLLLFPLLSTAQWTTQSTGFTDSARGIFNICPVNENVVWAIAYDASGNDSTIQEFTKTIDGGKNWVPGTINGATGFFPNTISALNADTAWVSMFHPDTDGGRIMRTNDGGQSWTHQTSALFTSASEAYPNMVYFWNKNEGFCMGDPNNGGFEIYTTNNGGSQWTRVMNSDLPALRSGDYGYEGEFTVIGNHVFFGTKEGVVYKSKNKGKTWTELVTPLASNNGRVRICEFRDTLNGIVADRKSNVFVMYTTDDGGATWDSLSYNGPMYGKDLHYIKGTWKTYISTGSAAGVSGASISYDGGHNWVDISGTPGEKYEAVAFPNEKVGWAGQYSQSASVGGIAKFTGKTIGFMDYSAKGELSLYPNPAKDIFTINCSNAYEADEVLIFDFNGKLIYQEKQVQLPTKVDLADVLNGLYIVKLTIGQSQMMSKLSILR